MRLLLVLLLAGSSLAANLNDPCNPLADECSSKANIECDPDEGICKCKSRHSPENTGSPKGCFAALDPISVTCVSDDFGAACNQIPFAQCSPVIAPKACECLRGYQPSSDSTVCLLNDFKERCLEDAQCAIFDAKATCQSERCVCPEGYAQDNVNNKCLEQSKLGDACKVDGECPENAYCKSSGILPGKKCACEERYFVADPGNEKCLQKVYKDGDDCVVDAQCVNLNLNGASESATCNNSKCTCPTNYVASNDGTKCLQKVAEDDPTGPCVQDVQCLTGYFCKYPNCDLKKLP